MQLKSVLLVATSILMITLFTGTMAFAGENATTDEVYELVLNAHNVVKELGEESFPAFNDPKGEFVLKDTYVVVIKCPSHTMTHPFVEGIRGMTMEKFSWFPTMCEATKNPNGQWIEYMWPKPKEDKPSRKLSFVIAVSGTPYAVVAGIYSDSESVEALNATIK